MIAAQQGILEYLHSRRRESIDFLKRLVSIETPSLVPESQREAQEMLAKALREAGFRTKLIPGKRSGGVLYGRPKRRRRGQAVQMLIGHSDTVWPLGTIREMPVVEEDGKLSGPGVFDMKTGLVQIVFALKALAELGLDPPLTPVVAINSDEEVGSPDSRRAIVRFARRAARVFVLEPALGPQGKLKTARKGVGSVAVTVKGKAAHAGLEPEKGASAILELSYVIRKLFDLNDPARGITVNVGVVQGGLRPNVIAPESRAAVDVRVWTMEDARRIEGAIRGIVATTPGVDLEIEFRAWQRPLERTERNRALWRLAVERASDLGFELEEGRAGGASDANTTTAYAPTLDGLGAVGDGAHARHEFIYTDRLVERTALLALLLMSKA